MTLEEFLLEWNNASDKVLVHTSGSTGKPKPLWVEKEKMLNSARITCDFLGLKPGDTFLLCMPLDYIAGKMVVVRCIERKLKLISTNPSGHPLAPSQDLTYIDFSAPNPSIKHITPLSPGRGVGGEARRGLGEARGGCTAMVPLQVYNTLLEPSERQLLMQMKHLLIGGGTIDSKLAKALRSFPNHVWSTYGMTETLSHIALRRLNGEKADDWYTPFDTVTLGQTADGCLTIDAPLVHDGLLMTNDIVEMRTVEREGKETKQFRIRGRKDNVIDSGGIKIQIEEVEAALKPFLKAAFTISKAKDEKFGEIVVLVTEDTDMATIQETCMNALPKYWQPRRYVHVDKLPMTETGKPARKEIEDLINNISTSKSN